MQQVCKAWERWKSIRELFGFPSGERGCNPGAVAVRGSTMQCHCGRVCVTALPGVWQPCCPVSQPESTATVVLAVVFFYSGESILK